MLFLSNTSNETVDLVLQAFKNFERTLSKTGESIFDRVDFDVRVFEIDLSTEFHFGISLYKDYKLVGSSPEKWIFTYSPWSLDNDHFETLRQQMLGLLDVTLFSVKSHIGRSLISA